MTIRSLGSITLQVRQKPKELLNAKLLIVLIGQSLIQKIIFKELKIIIEEITS